MPTSFKTPLIFSDKVFTCSSKFPASAMGPWRRQRYRCDERMLMTYIRMTHQSVPLASLYVTAMTVHARICDSEVHYHKASHNTSFQSLLSRTQARTTVHSLRSLFAAVQCASEHRVNADGHYISRQYTLAQTPLRADIIYICIVHTPCEGSACTLRGAIGTCPRPLNAARTK